MCDAMVFVSSIISPISTGMALKPWISVMASGSDANGSGYGKKESQRADLTILYVCPATRSSNGRRKGLATACPLRGVKNAVFAAQNIRNIRRWLRDEGGS
jgi:hypothetical protein